VSSSGCGICSIINSLLLIQWQIRIWTVIPARSPRPRTKHSEWQSAETIPGAPAFMDNCRRLWDNIKLIKTGIFPGFFFGVISHVA
jgi:hypothetical protein